MGNQKIVISERDNIAAIFEDNRAIEFIIHRGDVLLGDVYLAQVENILPSIDAAFVNVGTERMGFLHSSDVQGRGDLKSRLQPKQNIVVQVMKEPTGHKGPRVTMNVAMPGRFLVLMPESKGISISRKIAEQKERSRLKSIVSLMKPPGVGVIIRTEAENQSEPEIQEDFETLIERWQNIVAMADTAKPPTLLYRDQDLLYRVIREIVTEDVKEIVVDTQFGQQRANQLLQNWGIEHPVKVTLYQGTSSIMIGMGVDREIKQALQTKVPLPSGGYLYIQPTEALTVVDVNSGKFTSLQSQAETIRLTNLEAAKEIARQLKLRNIGGMIIVDFIDMESRANQLSILENFENELSQDKAKPQIGQLSDLGLVEMTRHRQGQSLNEIFTKKCIACNGTGLGLDDFLWAPGSGDAGRMASRHKLPIRQQRFNGQQQKPLPKPGMQTLKRFIDPTTGQPTPLTRDSFLQQSRSGQVDKTESAQQALETVLKQRTVKNLGIRLASCTKLARIPLEINSIMVRINPKSNDIFTLVDAIEGAVAIPGDSDNETDYEDMSDGSEGDGQDGSDIESLLSTNGHGDMESYEGPLQDNMDVPEFDETLRQPSLSRTQRDDIAESDEFEVLEDEQDDSPEADTASPARRRRGRPGVVKPMAGVAVGPTPPRPRRGRPPKKSDE